MHQIEGRIVGVHGGDSITLLDVNNRQHKIRLVGIDAPELGQPFGRASKQHLAELLARREAVAECSKIDRFRRRVCRVMVASSYGAHVTGCAVASFSFIGCALGLPSFGGPGSSSAPGSRSHLQQPHRGCALIGTLSGWAHLAALLW